MLYTYCRKKVKFYWWYSKTAIVENTLWKIGISNFSGPMLETNVWRQKICDTSVKGKLKVVFKNTCFWKKCKLIEKV